MSEHDKYPHLGTGYKRGTDYQPAPAHHVKIEVPEGYLNPNRATEPQALIAALEVAQAENAELKACIARGAQAHGVAMATDPLQAWRFCAAAEAENARLRDALRKLGEWDMLHLTPDGHGAATADAPWARALIDAALSECASKDRADG